MGKFFILAGGVQVEGVEVGVTLAEDGTPTYSTKTAGVTIKHRTLADAKEDTEHYAGIRYAKAKKIEVKYDPAF